MWPGKKSHPNPKFKFREVTTLLDLPLQRPISSASFVFSCSVAVGRLAISLWKAGLAILVVTVLVSVTSYLCYKYYLLHCHRLSSNCIWTSYIFVSFAFFYPAWPVWDDWIFLPRLTNYWKTRYHIVDAKISKQIIYFWLTFESLHSCCYGYLNWHYVNWHFEWNCCDTACWVELIDGSMHDVL